MMLSRAAEQAET